VYADSYFAIGTTHKICQDYALAGSVHNRFFAAVSDGCSSSRHTDFGARFLCIGTQEAMKTSLTELNQHSILPLACTLLGKALPWECLDATLMLTYTTDDLIVVMASGDGVIAARHRDGSVHTTEIEFINNAPAYLSYQLDNSRFQTYLSGKLSSGEMIEGCGIRETRQKVYDKNLAVGIDKPDSLYAAKVGTDPSSFWDITVYSRDCFDLVAVMSDGVRSFQKRNTLGQLEPVELQAVLQQLMKFKNVKGEFVTRRCKRFLSKYCVEHGWSHYDDFSMAAVYAEEEE